MFPKNAWYVAGYPDEVIDQPLGRTICNEKIAFFRGKNDVIAAVEDFCPHRGAALSMGYVQDGNLVCGYHGLVMGCDGKVVSMPMQRVERFPCVKHYPVVERHGFIWVWPGESTLADESLIPDLHWSNNPNWAYGGGLYHVKSDYRLMIDNLMDLTHETYVHSDSIGQDEIDETPVKTTVEQGIIKTSRFMENIIAPPFWQMAMKAANMDPEKEVDRWQISQFHAPGHVLIDVGVAYAGEGGVEAPMNKRVRATVVDFMTPETESSHWYFWGMARNFMPQDAELTNSIREGQGKIFSEDLAILEAQQNNIDQYPDRQLLMLNIDAGGVQARRVLDKLLQQERSLSVSDS